jgi:hypothetical protein
MALPSLQHIVPADTATKFKLLQIFAEHFKRSDIEIEAVYAPCYVSRTLWTEDLDLNVELWSAAGYEKPPTILQMVEELARHEGIRT